MTAVTRPGGAFLAEMNSKLAGSALRLLLPEGHEPRVLAAARAIHDQGIARVTLLGAASGIRASAGSEGVSLDGIAVVDPARDDRLPALAERYREARPRSREGASRRLLRKPLFFAGMMMRSGAADAMLAGVSVPTARVVEAGLMTVGLHPDVDTPSSCFLMSLPERSVIFADCALNIAPTAEQLADIAIASARNYRNLSSDEPRVALLSFSTHGSARHAEVDRVRQAVEVVKRRAPQLLIDGELQLDAALDPGVAARKLRTESAVAGKANVLVFPELNSGNIGYKLARHLTGSPAVGPILQGFARPIGDLSRGASVDEIVTAAKVLLCQALNDDPGAQPRSERGT